MSHEENTHAPAGHLSAGKYMVGFVLAVVLTLISFGLIVTGVQPTYVAVVGLILAAVVQILVHLHYFLHLDFSKEMQWNFISIAFTAIILFIFILGTVWVIFALNTRLM
ncbi:MAG TPA: cytochrome o ubiquinol oxidase subunit IV [Spirochaetia bacterium]|jgi:cytochrome o ubiquinol oxidase operon protein cyoD|nr:cytochrome o ubiquinol oxidase subunit IV [Spirochaetia bacterium]